MGSDQVNPLEEAPPPAPEPPSWELWGSEEEAPEAPSSGSEGAMAARAWASALRTCVRASSRYPAALVSAVANSVRASVSTA